MSENTNRCDNLMENNGDNNNNTNMMHNMFASLQISDVSSSTSNNINKMNESMAIRNVEELNCCDLNNLNFYESLSSAMNNAELNNQLDQDYPFLQKIFQTLFSHQDFINCAFFDGGAGGNHNKANQNSMDSASTQSRLSLFYQLMIKQLSFDGHRDIARALMNKLSDNSMNDITALMLKNGEDNTLFKLFNIMYYIEMRSKTDGKFSNLLNWFLSNNLDSGNVTTPPVINPPSLSAANPMPSTQSTFSTFNSNGVTTNPNLSSTNAAQLFHTLDPSSVIFETESDGPMSLSLNDASVGRARQLQVAYKFGQIGSEPGCLDTPHGFCLGVNDDIVIADTNNHRICVFAFNGKFKFSFGEYGTETGKLNQPRKIAMLPPALLRVEDADPIFIVCDRGSKRSRMQVFSINGEYLRLISIPPMDIVSGLITTQDRRIIAVDSVRSSLIVMNEIGGLLNWFTCSPYMMEPSDVAVHNKHFYICDFKGHNICVFNAHGNLVRRLSARMLRFPNGIDISNRGDIICGDSHGNRFHISVFNEQGQLLADYDCPFVKVSRCCGLRLSANGCIVTLAKNNNHAVVMNAITVRNDDAADISTGVTTGVHLSQHR